MISLWHAVMFGIILPTVGLPSKLELSGEFVISSVLSHCSKNLKWWTDQCYSSILFGKQRKIHTWSLRTGRPKRSEERSPGLILAPLFIFFFLLPLSLSYINLASQEGCLFHLRFSLQSLDLPLFYFHGLFPFFAFWPPPLWTPFSYSNYLTESI